MLSSTRSTSVWSELSPGYTLPDAAADAADKPTASAMPIAVLILMQNIDYWGAVQNGELRPRQF